MTSTIPTPAAARTTANTAVWGMIKPLPRKHIVQEIYKSEALDRILLLLRPYNPKKLIVGSHFIDSAWYRFEIDMSQEGWSGGLRAYYKGIPVEKSENKYELDFEL